MLHAVDSPDNITCAQVASLQDQLVSEETNRKACENRCAAKVINQALVLMDLMLHNP